MEKNVNRERLQKEAKKAMEHAYAPYSDFRVGACIELKDGTYIWGANIENAAYGSCMCAERSAIYAAYSKGYRKKDILALAIASDGAEMITPCGACRQVLSELLEKDTPILLTGKKKEKIVTVEELLPFTFGKENLEKEER